MDDQASARGSGVLQRIEGPYAYWLAVRFGLSPVTTAQLVYDRYGPLAEVQLATRKRGRQTRYVLAVGAKYNKRVLSDPETFGSLGVLMPGPPETAQRRIGRGLLGPSGPRHTHYRKMMAPPLRRNAVDAMIPHMAEIVDREIADWPVGRRVDLYHLVKQVTLNAALETLFPAEAGCGRAEALNAAHVMGDHFEMEASLAARACPINFAGSPYRAILRHAEHVEDSIAAWVKADGPVMKPDNLLSIIAHSPDEMGKAPTLETALNQVPSLFAASFETSQSALIWALFLIAQHPDAASRLLDEIQTMPEQLSEQPGRSSWIDAVMKESMRLLPTVPVQVRRANRDTDLVDIDVKESTYVVLNAFMTNRDAGIYRNPDRFQPERWAEIDPNQYEYLVFSAGARPCIGAWFAATFLKVAISRIVRRFRIGIIPNASINQTARVTMGPTRAGVPVILNPQDGRFKASPIRGNVVKLVGAFG